MTAGAAVPLVSIVVPVFNEEANLPRFHDAVSAVMDRCRHPCGRSEAAS